MALQALKQSHQHAAPGELDMAFLSLDNAQVLHAAGLPAANSQTKFRVELSDDATLSLFRRGLFGEQRAFSASLGMMALRT